LTATYHNQTSSKNSDKPHTLIERNILVNGKKYRIKLLKPDKGTHLLAEVNGKKYEVGLTNNPNPNTKFSIKIGNRSYKVELEKTYRNTQFPIKVNNKLFMVQYEAPNQATSLRKKEPTLSTIKRKPVRKLIEEEGIIVSPMPGTIVSLKIKLGDSVKVGDVVCVLEAMKMENEITTPMAGIAEEIRIKEGDRVDKGKALVKINKRVDFDS